MVLSSTIATSSGPKYCDLAPQRRVLSQSPILFARNPPPNPPLPIRENCFIVPFAPRGTRPLLPAYISTDPDTLCIPLFISSNYFPQDLNFSK